MNWIVLLCLIGQSNEHLALGNPSKATINSQDNQLIEREQYVLSFNHQTNTPNWVSWRLNKSWIGSAERQDDFRSDSIAPILSSKFYSKSGFDRGHMCPSEDRTNNGFNNSSTFLLTNFVPQSPKINRGPWVQLEEHCRKLASKSDLYIVAGPHGAGGTGSKGYRSKLGPITVPSACWKVVLIDRKRCIGVIMPNASGEIDWEHYKTSVREVEELTGYDFFSELPKKLQDEIELDD